MEREISAVNQTALEKAAAVIVAEQRRIFAQAKFLRDKKKHVYKGANNSLISMKFKKIGRAKIKAYIGFDTPTLNAYPELILVEFGRPGKSPRHTSDTEEVKNKKGKVRFTRKKGIFPAEATVMPIRAGFNLARENALSAYADEMFNRLNEQWRG